MLTTDHFAHRTRLTRGTGMVFVLSCLLGGAARAERLPIRIYTTADGLAHNTVNRIVRDSRGFLWFATGDGLSRFDGYTFINFGVEHGLPHSKVTDLLETRSGELWVATFGGLVRFHPGGVPSDRIIRAGDEDGTRPMFAVVRSPDPDRRAQEVTVLLETRDGTSRSHSDDSTAANSPGSGRDRRSCGGGCPKVPSFRGGEWWLAGQSRLLRYAAQTAFRDLTTAKPLRVFTERDGLSDVPGDAQVYRMSEDSTGNVWFSIRSRSNGLFRWNRATDSLTNLSTAEGPAAAGHQRAARARRGCRRKRATCDKASLMDEARRGQAERMAAPETRHFVASYDKEDIRVVAHGDTAVASWRFVITIHDNGQESRRAFRTTNVWLRRRPGWQVIAGHTSSIAVPA